VCGGFIALHIQDINSNIQLRQDRWDKMTKEFQTNIYQKLNQIQELKMKECQI
jgi:hypothetical protein